MSNRNPFGPCTEFEFEIADLADGALPPERAAQVQHHLAGCAPCRRWHTELAGLDEALAQALPRAQLSADFVGNLQARIRELDAAKRLAAAAARTAAESEYERMLATLRSWRWGAVLNGAAAASVVASALFALKSLAPALASSLDVSDPVVLPMLTMGVAVTCGVAVAARTRRYGFAALASLLD
jgi:predicted anti-sigma-YlaC factor YlaD